MDLNKEYPEIADQLKDALTPEQLSKLEGCESADEVIALMESEGFELNDEQMELVAGGKIPVLSNLLLKCEISRDNPSESC